LADVGVLQGARFRNWPSMAIYFRLLAPILLPKDITRVIYLDSDLIVRKSLSELWSVDCGKRGIVAVHDAGMTTHARRLGIQEDEYFNSGVMLIDLEIWRNDKIHEQVIRFIIENPEKIEYPDQDGLNAVIHGDWVRVSYTWNAQHKPKLGEANRLIMADPHIVHFSGIGVKPWYYGIDHPFKSEYRKYRKATPWPRYRETGKPNILLRVANRAEKAAKQNLKPNGLAYHSLKRGYRSLRWAYRNLKSVAVYART
jgi:lipopolysaccharide biosynthesis glycosyltransferase